MSDEDFIKYANSLKNGSRVIETERSALFGRNGIIYRNKDSRVCVMWDRASGEEGHLGTGITHGTRLLKDVQIVDLLSNK